MKTDEKLALELVREQDGHISDLAATVAADGQDHLLPSVVLEHLAECESCMTRVGEAAMLSIDAGEELVQFHREAKAVQGLPAAVRPPLPVRALLAALLLAALGALPALSNAPQRIAQLWSAVMAVAPHIVRGGLALARAGSDAVGPALWVASVLSVLVLFLTGLAIARALPRSSLVGAAQRGGG